MSKIRVADVVFRDDLYPRIEPSAEVIQRYAQNLSVLPPIEVNQNNILIDGFHRWTAHRKVGADEIDATITETRSEAEVYGLAIKRNAHHGLQLSEGDKRRAAVRLYEAGAGLSKEEISAVLSVSDRMVRSYLEDIDRHLREERNEVIQGMWLACYTGDEIADRVGASNQYVFQVLEALPKVGKPAHRFEDEGWAPPIYNIWSYAKKTNAVSHFGNSEQRILENLLYLYTQPLDIVVDPFAGGGATIDVCKARMRRYWVSDRKPIVEREKDIRILDIVTGTPDLKGRWNQVSLTYLDPPYWKQAENEYSTDPEDLANMTIDDFTAAAAAVVTKFAEKQTKGAIAMLMQPTQWRSPGREVMDHIVHIIGAVRHKNLKPPFRVACPYSTEQCTPQMVEWAKDNKKMLVLTRELIVWEIA